MGPGTIIPACLRTASSSATTLASPATKPARYPASEDDLDSEWMASRPVWSPSHTEGCSTDSGAASQANPR